MNATMTTPPERSLFDCAEERDKALHRVEAGAGEGFVPAARAFVLRYLGENIGVPKSGEEITDACKLAGIFPAKDDRAFGAVYLGLAREGRTALAQVCFDFLPHRAELDLAGWPEIDIFAHV